MHKQLLSFLLLAFLLSACEKPVDPVKTAKAVEWLKDRYKKQPPSGGWWMVKSIKAHGANIDVDVLTTDEHAGMIMQMPREAQFKLVTIAACPEVAEDIWHILDPNQTIELHVGGSGGVFIDVDCRMWRSR